LLPKFVGVEAERDDKRSYPNSGWNFHQKGFSNCQVKIEKL